jgi:hypothetical protein
MIRLPMANHPMAPTIALGIAIVASGLVLWPRPAHLGWSSAEAVEPQSPTQYASYEAAAYPVAYRPSSEARSDTLGCNIWDVSPTAMEAILQEMVRRGWQPPRSDVALASTQPNYRTPIEALDPDRPVWVSSSRSGAPVETGEIVDVTIEPGAPATDKPKTVTPPTALDSPAPEPTAPEAPASSN